MYLELKISQKIASIPRALRMTRLVYNVTPIVRSIRKYSSSVFFAMREVEDVGISIIILSHTLPNEKVAAIASAFFAEYRELRLVHRS